MIKVKLILMSQNSIEESNTAINRYFIIFMLLGNVHTGIADSLNAFKKRNKIILVIVREL